MKSSFVYPPNTVYNNSETSLTLLLDDPRELARMEETNVDKVVAEA